MSDPHKFCRLAGRAVYTPRVPPGPSSRLAYIDWLRGLACVLMFQTHCYDAWLGGPARNSTFFMWSQLGGTFPAPLFLFLAGTSFALVTDKLVKKGLSANQVAKTTIRRGAEIFALGLLFRIQEFAISLGWAPWSDLFRVDILNTIGLSMRLMGAPAPTRAWSRPRCCSVLRSRHLLRSYGPHGSRSSCRGRWKLM